jgi:hypothetical protein
MTHFHGVNYLDNLMYYYTVDFKKCTPIQSADPSGFAVYGVGPLRSWVQIPPGTWIFVCCVLSGIDLCGELITRPEESYQLWRVVVCDQETS